MERTMVMTKRVFMDYNSTTPLRSEAKDAMINALGEASNPSSVHSFGRNARSLVEAAREKIAIAVGTRPESIVLTSGATESNNTVINGFKDQCIWVLAIEHPSILQAAPEAVKIPVTVDGIADLGAFEKMMETEPTPDLISVMMVNNETGVIQPVKEMVKLAKARFPQVHFHTDAVQALGKIPVNFQALNVDYMSLSAHKCGGPQGVGSLVIAPGAKDIKFLHGGRQEKSRRAGTENVAGIVGFGEAARLAAKEQPQYETIAALRNKLEDGLQEAAPALRIFGKNIARTANTSAQTLAGVPSQTLIMALDMDGFAISSGSACSSGTTKKSRVAQAMNLSDEEIEGAYRISIGKETIEEDIDRFIESWSKIVTRMTNESKETAHA